MALLLPFAGSWIDLPLYFHFLATFALPLSSRLLFFLYLPPLFLPLSIRAFFLVMFHSLCFHLLFIPPVSVFSLTTLFCLDPLSSLFLNFLLPHLFLSPFTPSLAYLLLFPCRFCLLYLIVLPFSPYPLSLFPCSCSYFSLVSHLCPLLPFVSYFLFCLFPFRFPLPLFFSLLFFFSSLFPLILDCS